VTLSETFSKYTKMQPGSRGHSAALKLYELMKPAKLSGTYYSHYGEDVLLKSLFANETGTYVDVGAGHPILGSNTYALYKKGWRGLTIDPILENVRLARKKRPRDTALHSLCGEDAESVTLWTYEIHQYSTTSPERVAELRERGLIPLKQEVLRSVSLASLGLRTDPRDASFLSIDVEGMELQVLQGNDWNAYLPSLIICEEISCPWLEPREVSTFLQNHGYELSDYVGLSSFYIHADSPFRFLRGKTRS
jgi:FkbM family methyltransferase